MSESKCPHCGECDHVLIWKPERGCWYRPDRSGYTELVVEAGRYWRCNAQGDVDASRSGLELETIPEAIASDRVSAVAHLANFHIAALQEAVGHLGNKTMTDLTDAQLAEIVDLRREVKTLKEENERLLAVVDWCASTDNVGISIVHLSPPDTAECAPEHDWLLLEAIVEDANDLTGDAARKDKPDA